MWLTAIETVKVYSVHTGRDHQVLIFLIFISEENLIVIGCYFSHNKAGKLISSRFSGFSGIRNFVIIDKAIQTVFQIRKPRTAYIERTVRSVHFEQTVRTWNSPYFEFKSTKPPEQLIS